MSIFNYTKFLERVQPDFFDKNPGFYLNPSNKPVSNWELENEKLKNIKVEDIKIKSDNINIYFEGFSSIFFRKEENKKLRTFEFTPYLWKLIVATVKNLSLKTITFASGENFNKNINEIFKNLPNYYGLYYEIGEGAYGKNYELFLTTIHEKYSEKLKESKNSTREKYKIIYYNNKVKDREFFDISSMKNLDIMKKFKNIRVEDVDFKEFGTDYTKSPKYKLKFKNDDLTQDFISLKGDLIFDLANESQMEDQLFGDKIGHRYHMYGGLPDILKGIGLGYKIYKAFIKRVGYICSNSQSSGSAQNIYNKLLKDPDYYSIVDKGSRKTRARVMIIDKNYPYLQKLLDLVKKREIKEKTKYIYDKELNFS
jgi:hypothetical protein